MPFEVVELDSSYVKEENIKIILGRTIILKMTMNKQTQALLTDDDVKKFVSIRNLCNDHIRSLIIKLIEQETYLTAPSLVQSLMQEKDKLEMIKQAIDFMNRIMGPIMGSKFYKAMEKQVSEEERFQELLEQEDLLADLLLRAKGEIDKRQLQEYENRLLTIDKEIEEKTGLSLLVPSTLFICPNCKVILGDREIANKKCYICKKDISRKKERIPISKMHDKIRYVWLTNLWFEAYVAGLLRKLGWETWIDVNVMGASGILHQIDVLGINKKFGTVLVVECKTGKISRNDVFTFSTKTQDIKAHNSILALIEELPEPETRTFVTKNPMIILLENMGNRTENEILEYLEGNLTRTHE